MNLGWLSQFPRNTTVCIDLALCLGILALLHQLWDGLEHVVFEEELVEKSRDDPSSSLEWS